MNKWIRYSLPFLIMSLILALVVGYVLLTYDKVQTHLWFNQCHTTCGDFFFRYYTYVGEWVPYVIVAGLLFYKSGWASFLLIDVLLSGLIGQGIKYWADTDRPYRYFELHCPDIQLPFVDGVELSRFYSFPSGHTITFFVLMMTLTILVIDRLAMRDNQPRCKCYMWWISLVFFVLAVLGAYSRIYLSQHFLEDIFGGSIIGVVTTAGLLCLVPKIESTRFWNWNLTYLHK